MEVLEFAFGILKFVWGILSGEHRNRLQGSGKRRLARNRCRRMFSWELSFFLDDSGNQVLAALGKPDRISSARNNHIRFEYRYENNFSVTIHLHGASAEDACVRGISLSCPNFDHNIGVISDIQPTVIRGPYLRQIFGVEPVLHRTQLGKLCDLAEGYYEGSSTICEDVLGLSLRTNTGTEGLVTVTVGTQWMTSDDSVSTNLSEVVGRCISLSDEGSLEVSNSVRQAFSHDAELPNLAKTLPVTSIDVFGYCEEDADEEDTV